MFENNINDGSHPLHTLRIFIPRLVHQRAHRISDQFFRRVGLQEFHQLVRVIEFWIQPRFIIFPFHDHGHSIMNFLRQLIWFGGDDSDLTRPGLVEWGDAEPWMKLELWT